MLWCAVFHARDSKLKAFQGSAFHKAETSCKAVLQTRRWLCVGDVRKCYEVGAG